VGGSGAITPSPNVLPHPGPSYDSYHEYDDSCSTGSVGSITLEKYFNYKIKIVF